jgi:hypothetical protein
MKTSFKSNEENSQNFHGNLDELYLEIVIHVNKYSKCFKIGAMKM